jgi:hypothetical protein
MLRHIGGKIFTFPNNASFVAQPKQNPPFLVEDYLLYPRKSPRHGRIRTGVFLVVIPA